MYLRRGFVRRPDLDVVFPGENGVGWIFTLDLTDEAQDRFGPRGRPASPSGTRTRGAGASTRGGSAYHRRMAETTAQTAAHALAVEQDQVGSLLDRLGDALFESEVNPLALERLMLTGHFMGDYGFELDWTPRQIAGHLRDSARVFTERIRRIRAEDEPRLADFVTDAPDRLDDYAATTREDLRTQLDDAQAELRAAVADIPDAELDRAGVHEVDGRVTLRELVAFLPEHQSDHREQLAAFAAAPL